MDHKVRARAALGASVTGTIERNLSRLPPTRRGIGPVSSVRLLRPGLFVWARLVCLAGLAAATSRRDQCPAAKARRLHQMSSIHGRILLTDVVSEAVPEPVQPE